MVLLLFLASLQQASAEETLKKIEETILSADSFQVKFKVEIRARLRGITVSSPGSGSLLLKKENRMAFGLQIEINKATQESRLVSDGNRMRVWNDGKERGELAADPSLRPRVVGAFVRGQHPSAPAQVVGKDRVGPGLAERPDQEAAQRRHPSLVTVDDRMRVGPRMQFDHRRSEGQGCLQLT